MGFTSKMLPNNILKNCLLKKLFNWLRQVVPICILPGVSEVFRKNKKGVVIIPDDNIT
jgi:hypothetical protein